MEIDPVPVNQIHAETLASDPFRERIVALMDPPSRIVVATRRIGEINATSELEFDIAEAERLANACLAGNERAMTTPGLARMLCATIIVLSRAALLAGALVKEPDNGGTDDDPSSTD